MNAKSCQTNSRRSCAAPDIQRTQRIVGSRGEKILQIGKGQVGAQPTFGRLKVSGILVRSALEAFGVGLGHHLHVTLRRSIVLRSNRWREPGVDQENKCTQAIVVPPTVLLYSHSPRYKSR